MTYFFSNEGLDLTINTLSKQDLAAIEAESPGQRPARPTALLNFRGGKDTDLTAKELTRIGEMCLKAAKRLKMTARHSS